MANEKRLIDANGLSIELFATKCALFNGESEWVNGYCDALQAVLELIVEAPTVQAVELPKGKPGDYLEWDNGTGFRQIYYIYAVMICEDCMRYDLEEFTPAVNHKNIVRIMSREEAKVALAKMDGDGNG